MLEQEDPAIASCEEAYKEGRAAIAEGEAILREVAISTTIDSIMVDANAQRKRAAEPLKDVFSEDSDSDSDSDADL